MNFQACYDSFYTIKHNFYVSIVNSFGHKIVIYLVLTNLKCFVNYLTLVKRYLFISIIHYHRYPIYMHYLITRVILQFF